MPFRRNSGAIGKFLMLLGFIMLLASPLQAQNKKKKKKKYKKKSDANILSRAYNDVTTRNNYYFNANLIYKGILTDVELQNERSFDDLLPIYFHQNLEDFSTYGDDLESIIKKTSVAMQLHDNTRWKDNAYLLLGKARYLNGEYYDALNSFHFVVTTMKKDVGKKKGAVDNKAKLKAMKAKEAAKKAKERQKEIQAKKDELKDKLSQLKRDKEKQMAASAKERDSDIKKKIKAKEKIIALRKKGKPIPDKLREIAYGKKDDTEQLVDQEEEKDNQESGEKEDKTKEPTVVYKTDYRSDKKIQKDKEAERQRELAELGDTIPMTEKEIERYDDLSFWEKIKHKESRPEALVWLAKSLMKVNRMAEAQTTLEYAEALPKLTRKQREEVYAGQAFYYLENRRYANALEALSNAALYSKKKKKPFYQYLGGQVNELIKDYPVAIGSYREVAEGKADYKMKFNANIRLISIMQEEGSGSDDEVIELLTKLLKNGSNKEYRDQIHYRLADIYSARGDIDMTIEHLQESITTSRSNPTQKGLSFKELGEVYLLQENYNAAAIFYDSAVAVLPTEYLNYEAVSFRADAVAEAAVQANIIATTDSLLLLSTMSDKDLELYLAELKARQKVEGKKRKNKGGVTDFIDEIVIAPTGGNITASGDWYFYNPNLRAQGYTQFRQIWGDRALEHDWRRSSKEAVFDIASISNIDKKEVEVEEVIEKEVVVLEIPKTEEEIAEAHKNLSEAYYELGKILRNKLEINSEAKQSFESLVSGYPEFSRIDRAYYYLYLIYTDEKDLARAEHYKNILLKEYPVSQYAYAINHPYQAISGEDRPEPAQVEVLYTSTYDMFVDGKYVDVIQRRKEAFDTYKESPLMPKFDFLEALSYGHLDSLSVLKAKLGTIIAKYPDHEVEPKAREYLAIINRKEIEEGVQDTVVVAGETDTVAFVSIYSNIESNSIFGMVAVRDKDLEVREMIQLLDQFNTNSFKAFKLRVSNAYLDKDTPLILIKRFREKTDAIDYIGRLEESLIEIFGAEQSTGLDLLMITQDNFRTLFTTKKLDEYGEFYERTFK